MIKTTWANGVNPFTRIKEKIAAEISNGVIKIDGDEHSARYDDAGSQKRGRWADLYDLLAHKKPIEVRFVDYGLAVLFSVHARLRVKRNGLAWEVSIQKYGTDGFSLVSITPTRIGNKTIDRKMGRTDIKKYHVGISWCNDKNKWRARIFKNGGRIELGYFDDLDKAVAHRASML